MRTARKKSIHELLKEDSGEDEEEKMHFDGGLPDEDMPMSPEAESDDDDTY
jgi:hypothetical protein